MVISTKAINDLGKNGSHVEVENFQQTSLLGKPRSREHIRGIEASRRRHWRVDRRRKL